jgi:acyl phosphate:glycerol-3-phosphate acyltransferase
MNIVYVVIALCLAYLLGSIPTAVWVGKTFHGIDVREHGSGNAGATNVIRVLGWKTGIPVMIVDIGKGWLAAYLPVLLHLAEPGSAQVTFFQIHLIDIQILTGLTSIIGHVYPILAGFRGGKGVACTVGVLVALHPFLTLSCIAIFLVVLLITGYVSVASMSMGIAFPILLFTLFNTPSTYFKIFSVFIAIAIILTHRKNIKRLLKGEESKFIKRKQKS